MAYLKSSGGGGGWKPSSTALAYYTFDDQGADGYVKDILNGYNLIHGNQPTYTQVLGTNYAGNYNSGSNNATSYGAVGGWTSYLNSSFSLALWFKVTDTSQTNRYICGLGDGSQQIALIYNYNSGKVETYGDTRATILSDTQANTWYCLGISRGSGTLKTYLNGTLINTVGTTHNQGNSDFSLGGTDGSNRFPGLIGECVTDSVLWSDTDFKDYFDGTKDRYWSKWTPGANTLAYYPLENDTNDATGKTSFSGTLVKNGIGYKATATSSFDYGEIASFLNFWVCVNAYPIGNKVITINGRSGGYYPSHSGGFNQKIFSFYNSSYSGYSASFAPTTGTWHNISVGYDGSKTIYSIDGVVSDLGTNPGYSFDYNFLWDAMDVNLSKIIVEKECWTADEIAGYYMQTKGNYGL